MVAASDIPAGTTVLEEAPAVWGPNNKSLPVCLGCLKPTAALGSNVIDEDKTCSKCRFPMCSKTCEFRILSYHILYDTFRLRLGLAEAAAGCFLAKREQFHLTA